jgi:hypothetical protein
MREFLTSALVEVVVSCPGRFTSGESASYTHWIGAERKVAFVNFKFVKDAETPTHSVTSQVQGHIW